MKTLDWPYVSEGGRGMWTESQPAHADTYTSSRSIYFDAEVMESGEWLGESQHVQRAQNHVHGSRVAGACSRFCMCMMSCRSMHIVKETHDSKNNRAIFKQQHQSSDFDELDSEC